jgi:excisionase family DNA binding protein
VSGFRGDSNLLTIPAAAVILGVSDDTAARLARKGQLPGAMKIGRSWRVSRPRLLNHLHGVPLPSDASQVAS